MNSESSGGSYRFGRFVLDPRERRLEDGEREVHLRPKTLDTLIRLVERQGHLVTKQELLDVVWAGTEVTENVLTQCIRELRETLGDDQKDPRFIQTVQRAGYRFIADVERAPADGGPEYEEEVTSVSVLVAEDKEAPAATTVQALRAAFPRRRRALLAAAALALTAVAIGAGVSRWWRAPGLSFDQRDWILVGDLDNLTGEAALDRAVRAELERELSMSRYVNFVPPGRVADTLRLMRKPTGTRVTEEVGREICLRDGGIRAMLGGSISAIGGSYSVALKLIEPSTGAAVAAFDGRARSRNELLPALRRLAVDVRRRLGDPLAAVAAPGRTLERVTTPSLEALTLYSRGLVAMDQFEWGQAEVLFDQALIEDPDFAAGYLFRGLSRMMISRDPTPDFARAEILAGGVTPRERLFIRAMHTYAARGAEASLDLFESLVAQYPDDYWAHEFASWPYLQGENRVRWEAHQAAARRLRPNFAQPHFHAGWVGLLYDGEVETSRHEFARVLELRPDFPSMSVQCSRGLAFWMQGQMDRASGDVEEFRAQRMAYLTTDGQVSARRYLARFYAFVGKPRDALAMLGASHDAAAPGHDEDIAGRFRFERALIYQDLGHDAESMRMLAEIADASLGMERIEALGWLGIMAARHGMKSRALALAQDLGREAREPAFDFWHPRVPVQTERARRAFTLQIEGELLLEDRKAGAAVERFDQVRALVPARNALFSTVLSPRVWLAAAQSSARAHEQLADWRTAAADYQAVLNHKTLCIGTDGASEVWIAALKAIGPVLEKAGRPDEAARHLEEYRRLRPK